MRGERGEECEEECKGEAPEVLCWRKHCARHTVCGRRRRDSAAPHTVLGRRQSHTQSGGENLQLSAWEEFVIRSRNGSRWPASRSKNCT